MVAEIAHLWLLKQLIPTGVRDSVLRTYWRQRGEHVRKPATCIQRMQKALTQMNVQLARRDQRHKRADRTGDLRAIVAGEAIH